MGTTQSACRYSASSVKQSTCLQHQGLCPGLVATVRMVVVVCDAVWLLMQSKHCDKRCACPAPWPVPSSGSNSSVAAYAHTVGMQMLQDTQAYFVTGHLRMLLTAGKGNNAHVSYIADGCLHRIKESSGGLVVGLLQHGYDAVFRWHHILQIKHKGGVIWQRHK